METDADEVPACAKPFEKINNPAKTKNVIFTFFIFFFLAVHPSQKNVQKKLIHFSYQC
jgi:hypothetical protein